jgi:hypothetical protein
MFKAAGLIEIRDTTLANEARHIVAFAARKPIAGEDAELTSNQR